MAEEGGAPPARSALELLVDIDEDVSTEAVGWLPSREFVADWTARALASEIDALHPRDERDAAGEDALRAPIEAGTGMPVRHELSVRLVRSATMRALNRDWRGRDRPTNVLSFPAGLPALPLEGGGSLLVLGDLALCPVVIAREALDQGKPPEAHWAHLIVHGVLHLRGLDHEEEDEAAAMETLESRLLSLHDIPDPYHVRVDARAPRGASPRHD